eukprot:PhF_6_TR31176/c0_g1_i1/m.45704
MQPSLVVLFVLTVVSGHWAVVAQSYRNPLSTVDTPDPGAIYVNNVWYVATTGCDGTSCYPIRSSRDMVTWSLVGYVFPNNTMPAWSYESYWAPEIHAVPGSPYKYHVYYATRQKRNGVLCVGVAISQSHTPLGPYVDPLGQCLFQNNTEGAIDPSFIVSRTGILYLLWKDDGNAVGKATPIYAQRLLNHGVTLDPSDTPHMLLIDDQPYELHLIEAPWMIYDVISQQYFLFYSSGHTQAPSYAVGVAIANDVLGPFSKITSLNPILSS